MNNSDSHESLQNDKYTATANTTLVNTADYRKDKHKGIVEILSKPQWNAIIIALLAFIFGLMIGMLLPKSQPTAISNSNTADTYRQPARTPDLVADVQGSYWSNALALLKARNITEGEFIVQTDDGSQVINPANWTVSKITMDDASNKYVFHLIHDQKNQDNANKQMENLARSTANAAGELADSAAKKVGELARKTVDGYQNTTQKQ